MSRQLKRQQREADILTATIKLLEERSFLDLRMSDIAKAADCSMGAIYSHFSSKEDLLLGCADAIHRLRLPVMNSIIQQDLPPHEKLILISFSMWIADDKFPNHYRLQQLAMNPSVWERASTQRTTGYNDFCNEMYDSVKLISKDIIHRYSSLEFTEELALQLEIGIFSTCLGLFQIKESGFKVFEPVFSEDDILKICAGQIKRLFAGWNITPPNFDERLTALKKLAADIVDQEIASV